MNDKERLVEGMRQWEHLRHMTDGRWHDDCRWCLNRRTQGGNGIPSEERIPVEWDGHRYVLAKENEPVSARAGNRPSSTSSTHAHRRRPNGPA